jgi:acetyl-CoA acetyltransferase
MTPDPARTPVIVDGLRTPFGRYGGALKHVRPDDMAAHVIRALVERTGVDPATIDDVILGAANQAGEDNRNVGRMSALLAGLPIEVAGQTVNRLCGSGLQAVVSAAHAIAYGDGSVFVAWPMRTTRTRWARPPRTSSSDAASRVRSRTRSP